MRIKHHVTSLYKKILTPVVAIPVLLLGMFFVYALNTWDTGYRVDLGQSKNVIGGTNGGGCCYTVFNQANPVNGHIFVPTNTYSEFCSVESGFAYKKPSGVIIAPCQCRTDAECGGSALKCLDYIPAGGGTPAYCSGSYNEPARCNVPLTGAADFVMKTGSTYIGFANPSCVSYFTAQGYTGLTTVAARLKAVNNNKACSEINGLGSACYNTKITLSKYYASDCLLSVNNVEKACYPRAGGTANCTNDIADPTLCGGTAGCTWVPQVGGTIEVMGHCALPYATCGIASGWYYETAPTKDLCSNGTVSNVTGSGPWTWSCNLSGTTANCSANTGCVSDSSCIDGKFCVGYVPGTPPTIGQCVIGCRDNTDCSSTPSTPLCSGYVSSDSFCYGTGTYTEDVGDACNPQRNDCDMIGPGEAKCYASVPDLRPGTNKYRPDFTVWLSQYTTQADCFRAGMIWTDATGYASINISSTFTCSELSSIGVSCGSVEGCSVETIPEIMGQCVAPPVIINGQCGPSSGTILTSAPTTGLCNTGISSAVIGSGPWDWTCQGTGGGTTSSCFAYNGICGSSDGLTFASPPTANLCNTGIVSPLEDWTTRWRWDCKDASGEILAGCYADKSSACDTTPGQCKSPFVWSGSSFYHPTSNITQWYCSNVSTTYLCSKLVYEPATPTVCGSCTTDAQCPESTHCVGSLCEPYPIRCDENPTQCSTSMMFPYPFVTPSCPF